MILSTDIFLIGNLVRTHGQNGEIQCHLNNDCWMDTQAPFIILSIDGIMVPFRMLEWREKGEDVLWQLQYVNSESDARRLVGCSVYMLRSDMADRVEDTSLTYQDLIGWTVVISGQERRIVQVDESTINTLAILDDESMVPLHEDLMEEVDEAAKRLVLNLPKGL